MEFQLLGMAESSLLDGPAYSHTLEGFSRILVDQSDHPEVTHSGAADHAEPRTLIQAITDSEPHPGK